MSKKKTSTFYLTERISLSTTNATTATIDLGAYVDVADRQCIAIEAVDFIFQGTSADEAISVAQGGSGTTFAQVSDLNRGGTLQFADDRALVASGTLTQVGGTLSNEADIYPDVYGARDGVRLVVNDQLYLTAETSALDTGNNKVVNVTVRIKAHVASLTAKDWMAIAIQSTAADN